jgi:hypothetical protein
MSYFELAMLISFGIAWPVNIYKTIKTRGLLTKSITFSAIIMIGYIMGILHKLIYNLDWVIVAYIINFTMVLADTLIYKNFKVKLVKNNNL